MAKKYLTMDLTAGGDKPKQSNVKQISVTVDKIIGLINKNG